MMLMFEINETKIAEREYREIFYGKKWLERRHIQQALYNEKERESKQEGLLCHEMWESNNSTFDFVLKRDFYAVSQDTKCMLAFD